MILLTLHIAWQDDGAVLQSRVVAYAVSPYSAFPEDNPNATSDANVVYDANVTLEVTLHDSPPPESKLHPKSTFLSHPCGGRPSWHGTAGWTARTVVACTAVSCSQTLTF